MPKIIAFCNQKGGVGKTTGAINIGTYLALANKRILLIDADPQGNATSGIGINKHSLESSIYEALLEQAEIEKVILPTQIENLSIAPSNLKLTGAEVELVPLMGREYKLKHAISKIQENFDYILIDCPPSLGLLTINALAASDTTLIPLQCEYYALEGLSQLLNTINLVRENLNEALGIEGVFLTMADYRTNLTDQVIAEARAFFKDKVYDTVIPRAIRLSEAPGFGKPIAIYDKESIGAQKYFELTQEILSRNEQPAISQDVEAEHKEGLQ